jgi:hypothetical protein
MRKLTFKEAINRFFEDPEEAVGSEYEFDDSKLARFWTDAYEARMEFLDALGELEDYLVTTDEDADGE